MDTDGFVKQFDEEAEKHKKEKVYLDEKALRGKNLYSCDVLTGVVKKVKPKKDYFKHTKTKVITKKLYVMTSPNFFYLTAKTLGEAQEMFQKQFDEMAKELADKGEPIEDRK